MKSKKPVLVKALGALLGAAACFGIGAQMSRHSVKADDHEHDIAHNLARGLANDTHSRAEGSVGRSAPPSSFGFFSALSQAVSSIQEKADHLSKTDQQNELLRLENQNLRLKLESFHYSCQANDAQKKTLTLAERLMKETGDHAGRTIASIHYSVPTNLLPSELYTLGLTYFKAKEDEKAAVIFTVLTDSEGDGAYKNAKNYVMAGVAWYRIDNFEMADRYFSKALSGEDLAENLPYRAQARLWRGLVAEKLKKHSESQKWLRDLVDHHPHSTEAAWVNNAKEARRAPAKERTED